MDSVPVIKKIFKAPCVIGSETVVKLNPMDTSILGNGIPNYVLDRNLDTRDFGPLATDEELVAINKVYEANPMLSTDIPYGSTFEAQQIIDNSWIQTYTGKKFYPLNPNPDDICIEDIAHALSNICRFTGHVSQFYSVAQHCVLVSYICNHENALHGLAHDFAEAYAQDLPSPIKRTKEFYVYREIENKIQRAICQKFALSESEPEDVKRADLLLLATEARDLMSPLHPDWNMKVKPLPFHIVPLPPEQAKRLLLDRFVELTIL